MKPDGDKLARAASTTPSMEGGQFWVLEGASWSSDYLAEMIAFPGAAHDDFVDATVQALTFLRQPPEPGMIGYYRNRVIANSTGVAPPFAGASTVFDLYERRCLEIEAGYCQNCLTNLLHKASVNRGLGRLCVPCSKRTA